MMSDAELMTDLAAVDIEVARRKKAYPLEPYALWALDARQGALARFEQRAAAQPDMGQPCSNHTESNLP